MPLEALPGMPPDALPGMPPDALPGAPPDALPGAPLDAVACVPPDALSGADVALLGAVSGAVGVRSAGWAGEAGSTHPLLTMSLIQDFRRPDM